MEHDDKKMNEKKMKKGGLSSTAMPMHKEMAMKPWKGENTLTSNQIQAECGSTGMLTSNQIEAEG